MLGVSKEWRMASLPYFQFYFLFVSCLTALQATSNLIYGTAVFRHCGSATLSDNTNRGRYSTESLGNRIRNK
jgi:hypothetical protein